MNRDNHNPIHAAIRQLPAETIRQAAGLCDGHSILAPQAYVDAGLPPEVVRHVTTTHRSDNSSPKSTIFVSDRPVDSLRGVYGLHLLELLADALGVRYQQCLGRGFQARAIQRALHDHFNPQPEEREI